MKKIFVNSLVLGMKAGQLVRPALVCSVRFRRMFAVGLMSSCIVATQAQLAVTVSPPKIVGQKAVVPLALKNNFPERIESARAVVFLLDEQGKMVSQGTRWVIGGGDGKPGLAAQGTNAFHFVITSTKPFTSTNMTTKVSFSRVVLEGGKLVDVSKDVKIESP